MELRDYIEEAKKMTGSIEALSKELGMERSNLSAAKSHKRGLTPQACIKLSEMLNIDLKTIIAASELATEQKEEKRQFWLPFVINDQRTQSYAKCVLTLMIVTNFMTSTPSEAAPMLESSISHICIMLSLIFILCIAGIFKNNRIFFAISQKTLPCSLRVAG